MAEPTTIAGVVAVLRYAVAFVAGGGLWPAYIATRDEGRDEDEENAWERAFHKTLAAALEKIASA